MDLTPKVRELLRQMATEPGITAGAALLAMSTMSGEMFDALRNNPVTTIVEAKDHEETP